jgi:hypothetical protein
MPRNTRTKLIDQGKCRPTTPPAEQQLGTRVTHLSRKQVRALALNGQTIGAGG